MKMKKDKLASGDKYTYFVTSPYRDKFDIEKLHMCSWAYENLSECLELGVQLKLKDGWKEGLEESGTHTILLPIVFWLPWLDEESADGVEDLYGQISKKEHAAFIFNDACPTATDCVENKSNEGQILTFSHRDPLVALPVDINVKGKGRLCVTIRIPSNYNNENDVYIRFCMGLPASAFCIRRKAFSKEVRVYNINLGQIRNQPKDLDASELCRIKDVFALHILPSTYLQTFTAPNAFVQIRILEADKYCRFAQGSKFLRDKIKQDDMIVSFSKISHQKACENREYPFYSVFERDCIGQKQVWASAWINIVCSLICAGLTSVAGCFYGRKTAVQSNDEQKGTNYCNSATASRIAPQQ